MGRIAIAGRVEVYLAAVKGSRQALEVAARQGDTERHAEVSRKLEETYAEVRRHCRRYGLPLPAGVPDED